MDRETTLLVKALSLVTIGFLMGGFFLWGNRDRDAANPEFSPVQTADSSPEKSPVQQARLTAPQEPEPDYEDPRDMSPDSWSQPIEEDEEPQAPYLTFDENGMVVDSYLGTSPKRESKQMADDRSTSPTHQRPNHAPLDDAPTGNAGRRSGSTQPVEYGKLPESEFDEFAPVPPELEANADTPFVNQPPGDGTTDSTGQYEFEGPLNVDSKDDETWDELELSPETTAEPTSRHGESESAPGTEPPTSRGPEVVPSETQRSAIEYGRNRDADDWGTDGASDATTAPEEQIFSRPDSVPQAPVDTQPNKPTLRAPAHDHSHDRESSDSQNFASPMQRNPYYDPNDDTEPQPIDLGTSNRDSGEWKNPQFQISQTAPPVNASPTPVNASPTYDPMPANVPGDGSFGNEISELTPAMPSWATPEPAQPPPSIGAAAESPVYRNPNSISSSPDVSGRTVPQRQALGRQPTTCDACDSPGSLPCVDCGRTVAPRTGPRCRGCATRRHRPEDCGLLSGPLHRRGAAATGSSNGFGRPVVQSDVGCWDAARQSGDHVPAYNPALGFRQPQPTLRNEELCGHPYSGAGEAYPSFGEILKTSRYFISADLMFLKPFFQDNTVINIANGGTTWGESLDFDHAPAFQVQAGFISPYGPGAGADYFQFDQNSNTRTFVSDGMTTGTTRVAIPGVGGTSEIAATMAGESLTVDHSLEVHSYGAFVFKALDFRRASLTGKFGVRKLHINQQLDAVLRDSMGAYSADLQHEMDFDGFGPQFGLEYRRKIGHTPLIFLTSLNNSLVFGNRDERIQNSCACEFFHTSSDEMIAIVDIYSGMEARKFVGEKRFLFGRLGFVNQTWFNGGTALDARNNFGFQGISFSLGYNR